jgi:MscS family membrane protein
VADAICDALARNIHDFKWIQPESLPLYEIVSGLMIIGAGVYAILVAWKIDLTAWLASAGIIGIAVGFAARDTLANLFAGIFILADAPYKLGDFIVLGNGERGMVTQIGIRSTRLLTRDDIEITIPNSVIANSTIVNETGGPHAKRRVRVLVGVAYGSDIDKVRDVLLQVASESRHSADQPEPRVRFRAFGDSSLDFQLQIWIDEPRLRGRAMDELNTAVYKRFEAEGIEIPFPQRVVHMQQGAG